MSLTGHRDPLVTAIQNATAEDLLFKDCSGSSFLAAANLRRPVVERALETIPLEVARQLDPEELLGKSGSWPLLLASVTSSDHAICMLETLGDVLPRIVNENLISDMCYRAALLGKFRIVLFLLDNGFSNWAWSKDNPCPAYPRSIVGELFSYKWRSHEELADARELFARLPCAALGSGRGSSFSVTVMLRNTETPMDLAELVVARTPEELFSGQRLALMVTQADERYYSMLWRNLPQRCFTEPHLLLGLLQSFYLAAPPLEELLEKCSDEALVPIPGEDSVLHMAAVSRIAPVLLAMPILLRAPMLRDYKNADGVTALEAARRRHGHHPTGVEACERLETMIRGHTSVKSAVK